MRGSLGCPLGQRRGSVPDREADAVPEALIVQDPHQAGSASGRHNVVRFEQIGEPIEDGQGPPGPRAPVDRVWPGGHRHPVRVDPDTLAGQGFDVGELCDPARPARDGSP